MRAFLKTFTKIASENYPEVRERACTCYTPSHPSHHTPLTPLLTHHHTSLLTRPSPPPHTPSSQVMEKTYICYAPWVFQKVWGFVSPMLDPRTASKFVIMGGPSEFLPRLQAQRDEMDTRIDAWTDRQGAWIDRRIDGWMDRQADR